MTVTVPAARAWPAVPREFYTFFSALATSANAAGSIDLSGINQRLTLIENAKSARVQGAASVQTQGTDLVYVSLQGDTASPGDTQYYGTNASGTKGWNSLYDVVKAQLVAGANITVTADDTAKTLTIAASGSAYPEGDTFPASPALNDKFYRTDVNLLCYFDGTRWLSCQKFPASSMLGGAASMPFTGTQGSVVRYKGRANQYFTELLCSPFVSGTNNSSNYWTVDLVAVDDTNTVFATIGTLSTAADSGSTWLEKDVALNYATTSDCREIRMDITKHGTPGSIFLVQDLFYRLIVT